MANVFHGTAAETADGLQKAGVTHFAEIGRRAPMTVQHVECLLEGMRAGLKPLVFIGSANPPDSPLYNPVLNPLTVGQQKEQLRAAFRLRDMYLDESRVFTLQDVGNAPLWAERLAEKLEDEGLAGRVAVHYRSKTIDAPKGSPDVRNMSGTEKYLAEKGIAVWHSQNIDPADDQISASLVRTWDLGRLTAEQRAMIAAPDYLVSIAQAARAGNPDAALLEKHNVPLTTLDLTLDRMRKEAGIPTADVVARAAAAGPVTAPALTAAAAQIIAETRSPRPQFSQSAAADFQLKIAQASCNQTGGDWDRNLANIFTAIDRAAEDGADMLCLEELGLTAYDRGDDFHLSDNRETRRLLQYIADYAAAKDPNLIVSVGHPWHYADKNIPEQHDRVKHPLFNAEDKAFNVQTLIQGGEIVSMSAKSYLFGYERGYEPRWFMQWEDSYADTYVNKHGRGRDGTILIDIPAMEYDDGTVLPEKTIPFGSPVVQFRDEKSGVAFNVFQNICHGKWVASRFEGLPDNSRYDIDNPLAQKAQRFDITVCVNPNASPPAANKIDKHVELDKMASKHCGVFVDTDGLGSSGSTFAQFGTRLMAQNGKIISEGRRLTFRDVGYTSQVVTLKSAAYKGHRPHAVAGHAVRKGHSAPVQDGPAPWEKGLRREMEEEIRNEALWQFDYERKSGIKNGLFQALSGGNDSCYNAVVRAYLKMELAVAERGIGGYIAAYAEDGREPAWAEAARAALAAGGEKAAKRAIMDATLTCVFMGTDNSDPDTLRAAQTLIEGGTMEDGTCFEGIGGKFVNRNVQRLLDLYATLYAGVVPGQVSDARKDVLRHELAEAAGKPEADVTQAELDRAVTLRHEEIRKEIAGILRLRPEKVSEEDLAKRVELFKATFEEVTGDVLSYADPKHQIAYENIQARLRQVLGAVFYNVENKLGMNNPNKDEGSNGYATFGGDQHGGMVGGNAHKAKARQRLQMRELYEHGLEGVVPPVKAFHFTNQLIPSAGLQPLGADGHTQQFDEEALGRSFEQIAALRSLMLFDRPLEQAQRRNQPVEVFEKARQLEIFAQDSIETLHDRVLLSYQKWNGQTQAKIHAAPVSLTYASADGGNLDHQVSLRTPNISANQRPEVAQMTLHCLAGMAARDGIPFEKLTGGRTLAALEARALADRRFGDRLLSQMWTPGARDGRKVKIRTLYEHALKNGLDAVAGPTEMSARLGIANDWRKKRAVAARTP